MTQTDFTELTHVYLTAEEWQRVEADYAASGDGDPEAFCDKWLRRELYHATRRMALNTYRLEGRCEALMQVYGRQADALVEATVRAEERAGRIEQLERLRDELLAEIATLNNEREDQQQQH